MKSTPRNRPRKLELTLMAAIAMIAVMALPGLATANSRHHHRGRHARHLSVWVSETVPNQPTTPGNTPTTGQDNAGTIASFDGTTLTITLNDGSTLAGQVTSSTEIECAQSTTQQGSNDGQQGDSGDQGQSGNSSGDQSDGQDQSGGSQDQSGGDQSEGDDSGSCTTAALVPGAIVHEAELEIGPNGAVFHSIHLAG